MNEAYKPDHPDTRKLFSKELFGNQKVVFIDHENAVYRLMITKQGKLILNK